MDITFIRDPGDFESLFAEWNSLLARSVTDVPFLRHEYLSAWWSTRGGGEWSTGELQIGIARDEGGDLIGLAPLFQTEKPSGQRALMFLGSIEISDYLDLIVPAEASENFARSLFAALDQEDPSDWETVELCNIPRSSPNLAAVTKAASERGWQVSKQTLQPCPVINIEQGWQAYMQSLDKKHRHELRRKMRNAARHPALVQWRQVGPEDDVQSAMQAFLDLMNHDPEKSGFLTEEMVAQFSALAQAGSEHGWLRLSFLEAAGDPIAGYLIFDYGNRIWVYNSGFHPEFLSLSPGWVLIGHIIQWAIEQGREEIDLLRGDEAYKYRLGGQNRWVEGLTLTR